MTTPRTDATEPAPASPTVARWELTLRLRDRRRELSVPVSEVTQALGISRTRWSQIENDHSMIATDKIPRLGSVLRFSQKEINELLALRQQAGDRTLAWWLDYEDILSGTVLRLYGLEHGARSIRMFDASVLNGMFQTAEYTRALIESAVDIRDMDYNRFVAIRMKRQERLWNEPRLLLQSLMTEAVLHFQHGSREILKNQLDHLAKLAEELHETIDIRIIPFTSNLAVGASTFFLIDFDNPHLPTAGYEESSLRNILLTGDDEEQIELMTLYYQQAFDKSLNREESLELIRATAKDLRRTVR